MAAIRQVSGEVIVNDATGGDRRAEAGTDVFAGGSVVTQAGSEVELELVGGATLRLDVNTRLELPGSSSPDATRTPPHVVLASGRIWLRAPRGTPADVVVRSTPLRSEGAAMSAACSGGDGACSAAVLDGSVVIAGAADPPLTVAAGEIVVLDEQGAASELSFDPDLNRGEWHARNGAIDRREGADGLPVPAMPTGSLAEAVVEGTWRSTYEATSVEGAEDDPQLASAGRELHDGVTRSWTIPPGACSAPAAPCELASTSVENEPSEHASLTWTATGIEERRVTSWTCPSGRSEPRHPDDTAVYRGSFEGRLHVTHAIVSEGTPVASRLTGQGQAHLEPQVEDDPCWDTPPSPFTIRLRVEARPSVDPEPEEHAGSVIAPGSIACVGDGSDGPRVRLMYVHATDRPDRVAEGDLGPTLLRLAANADQAVMESAALAGGVRRLRWRTTPPVDGTCEPVIETVPVAPDILERRNVPRGVIAELARQGSLDGPDTQFAVVIDIDNGGPLCGESESAFDDRPDPANPNNQGGRWAMAYGFPCAVLPSQPLLHELVHSLGAVQRSAPHYGGGGHIGSAEVSDIGDLLAVEDIAVEQVDCPSTVAAASRIGGSRLDCGNDDYFHPDPPAGSYLATHWNVADSDWLTDELGRLPNVSRIDDAGGLELSRSGWPRDHSADAVVLVEDGQHGAAPAQLARRVGGPVLLLSPDVPEEQVETEVRRVAPPGAPVYLVGRGADSEAGQLATSLTRAGYELVRVEATSPVDVAAELADLASEGVTTVLLADQEEPLVVAAAAAAAAGDAVLLLTRDGVVPAATQGWLDRHPEVSRVAIGREAAQALPEADAITGASPVETTYLIARRFAPRPSEITVVGAIDAPYVASAAASAAARRAPLLVTDSTTLSAAVRRYVSEVSGWGSPEDAWFHMSWGRTVRKATLVGGTQDVGEPVAASLAFHLNPWVRPPLPWQLTW